MELKPRNITDGELALVKYLLNNAPNKSVIFDIPEKVYTMTDGGMGSIHFITAIEQKHRADIVNGTYIDVDKMPVFISLLLGDNNELFELNFFKGDFSKLIVYPKPEQVIIDRR